MPARTAPSNLMPVCAASIDMTPEQRLYATFDEPWPPMCGQWPPSWWSEVPPGSGVSGSGPIVAKLNDVDKATVSNADNFVQSRPDLSGDKVRSNVERAEDDFLIVEHKVGLSAFGQDGFDAIQDRDGACLVSDNDHPPLHLIHVLCSDAEVARYRAALLSDPGLPGNGFLSAYL